MSLSSCQWYPSLVVECSFCDGRVCSGWNKSQYWIGDISQDSNFTELEDPEYKDKIPLPKEFINGTPENRTINLPKIVQNLHHVVDCIKQPSSYKELEYVLTKGARQTRCESFSFHDQVDERIKSIKSSYGKDEQFTVPYFLDTILNLKYPSIQADTNLSNIHFIDCEYMLKVSIPQQKAYSIFLNGKMFKPKDKNTTEHIGERDKFRWIFIPSSERFDQDVILDSSYSIAEDVMSTRDALCFVVVRENQFDRYRYKIGDKLSIIQLPESVIGIGYSRFWIVKIAKHFKLENIWIIDGRVDFFKEYFPTKNGKNYEKDPEAHDRRTLNIRCPEYCLQKIESIMKKQQNLVAISPRKYAPFANVTNEFSYKPIQSVMLLNIIKLEEKNLNFRPELRFIADMIFSQECKNAGLQLCTWNTIFFVNKSFETTGASTPN